MTYYLIDYENTGENGLDGIIELSNDDKVIIFYSDNADKMSLTCTGVFRRSRRI